MKKVILLFWLIPSMVFSQISENFESGIVSHWVQAAPGRWSADTVSPLSGRYSLHHIYDSPEAGSDQAAISLLNLKPLLDTVRWSFRVRHGYDPSSSNNWSVFLMTDNGATEMRPGGNVNGYALGVNLSGSDDTLRLWKVRGGSVIPVVAFPVNWQNNIGVNNNALIEAQRTPSGIWTLKITSVPGNLTASVKATDNEFSAASWFGLLYRYTSTRDRLLWIDDIAIDGEFSDVVNPPVVIKPGDLVITEIMADPSPPVLLPQREYIEIKNRTDHRTDLYGWKIIAGEDSYSFPVSGIEPGKYAIVCLLTDTSLFSRYGTTIGMKSFPLLNDAGKSLIITEPGGKMVHCVEYSSSWYSDDLRSGGGWSLEMIDEDYPFFQDGNWRASVASSGGTPGRSNSVAAPNRDNFFEGILNAFPSDSFNLEITFSEPVADPGLLEGRITISGSKVSSLVQNDLPGKRFSVVPQLPFQRGRSYTFSISHELTDRAGNSSEQSSFVFGLPEIPAKGDIIFNELLFNPLPGDADYIELFNVSDKPVDASLLLIAARDDASGKTSVPVPVSEIKRIIMPGQFYTITENRTVIVNRYSAGNRNRIFDAGSMPSMPDTEGHLLLYGRQLDVYDEVKYDEDMHFSLLSGKEGVSLEKISPRGSSMDKSNWHSASGTSGWGTPGTVNSVFSELPAEENMISFSSTRISPDNDGTEDVLTIRLVLEGTGNVVSIAAWDEHGSPVRKIAENVLSGPESFFSWDGSDDTGSLVERGIYIIMVSVFTETGKTQKWKRVCTVIR